MAEEHVGPRPDRQVLWTKIFTAFRLARDVKMLVLAALGIVITAIGWVVLAWLFYLPFSTPPQWKNFEQGKTPEEREADWNRFKVALARWNLLHELAGNRVVHESAADVAATLDEYEALEPIEQLNRRYEARVEVRTASGGALELYVPDTNKTFKITAAEADAKKLVGEKLAVKDIHVPNAPDDNAVRIGNVMVKVDDKDLKALRDFRKEAEGLKEIQDRMDREENPEKRRTLETALDLYKTRLEKAPTIKPYGRLLVLPWFEERGPNPYLLVADTIKQAGGVGSPTPAWRTQQFGRWFFLQEVPVLLEPLFKFLTPVLYLFDPRAGFWEYLLLTAVILCTLAVWGFFGGALARIAAVQFARGERVTLRDAVGFARDRFLSFFAAPVFPLFFLLLLTCGLIVFGFFELIPIFGDIIVAGVLWGPIVLLVGTIMAVVLVGLVGWPLMYATISTEASDSFDALSRSYSYVYQAPWHYLWYSVVAAVYGAALVFFVTFMASLLVFLGKWGVAKTPGMIRFDREPSYLFTYAPTSYGWRDLLISDSPHAVHLGNFHYEFQSDYDPVPNFWRKAGAALVSIWIYVFFLVVVGFSYSYFWSAGTIIYFLMRRQVDDTDLDEVHLEGEGLDEPFTKPATPPAAAKPGAVSLTMVEAPALRTAVTAGPSAPPAGVAPPPPVTAATPAPVPAPAPEVVTQEPAPAPQESPPAAPGNGEGNPNP